MYYRTTTPSCCRRHTFILLTCCSPQSSGFSLTWSSPPVGGKYACCLCPTSTSGKKTSPRKLYQSVWAATLELKTTECSGALNGFSVLRRCFKMRRNICSELFRGGKKFLITFHLELKINSIRRKLSMKNVLRRSPSALSSDTEKYIGVNTFICIFVPPIWVKQYIFIASWLK